LAESLNSNEPTKVLEAILDGVHHTFIIGFFFALVAVIVSILIKRTVTK